jgi:hypothetical protein
MVICFFDLAKATDPEAFPPGSAVQYWPDFADERQRKAFESVVHSRV